MQRLNEKDAISGFPVSPGSAEALVMWGRIIQYILIAYFLDNIYAKNYRNRTMCVKIIVSHRWDVFLRHSVFTYLVPFSRYSELLICRKCVWRPRWGDLIRSSPRSLASENSSPRICLAVLREHRLVTDGQTDTGPYSIHSASIASWMQSLDLLLWHSARHTIWPGVYLSLYRPMCRNGSNQKIRGRFRIPTRAFWSRIFQFPQFQRPQAVEV